MYVDWYVYRPPVSMEYIAWFIGPWALYAFQQHAIKHLFYEGRQHIYKPNCPCLQTAKNFIEVRKKSLTAILLQNFYPK